MVNVVVREGESIEEALRRFKRECERHGILQEIKKREYYKPPSVIKKEKMNELRRKLRRRTLRVASSQKVRKFVNKENRYSRLGY